MILKNKFSKKNIFEILLLSIIWIIFWIWIMELFISSIFWNIKTVDYINIWNNQWSWSNENIKIIEKPILITKTDSEIKINDWLNIEEINKIIQENDKKENENEINNSNIEEQEKIPNEYEIELKDLIKKEWYNGWYFIDKIKKEGIENINMETAIFSDWRIVPVVQSIWANVPLEEIWRTYFNTDYVYLDKEHNYKAFVMYAHSNYWKWWVEIWETLLKEKIWSIITLWNKKIKIIDIQTKKDSNLEFNKILSKYWNDQNDVIFYTCYKIDWKYLGKKFYIWKVIE